MSLNAASLVDLKAELARKQSQFQQERLNPEQRDIRLQVCVGVATLPSCGLCVASWRLLFSLSFSLSGYIAILCPISVFISMWRVAAFVFLQPSSTPCGGHDEL